MDWTKPESGGAFLEIVEDMVVEQPSPEVDLGNVEAVDMYWEHMAEGIPHSLDKKEDACLGSHTG